MIPYCQLQTPQPAVVNMNRVIQQYCRKAMRASCEGLCQFILDLIMCGICMVQMMSAECILDKDEICEIIKFLAAD